MKNIKCFLISLIIIMLIIDGQGCGFAFAHSELNVSSPFADEIVKQSPKQIVLGFSEGVEADVSSIHLMDANHREVNVEQLRRGSSNAQLVLDIPELTNGTYQVEWIVISVDGHSSKGNYAFVVDVPKVITRTSPKASDQIIPQAIVPAQQNVNKVQEYQWTAIGFVAILVITGLIVWRMKRSNQ